MDEIRTEECPQHAAYWAHDVPCVALTSGGVANVTPKPSARAERVSRIRLAETGPLTADAVEALQDRASDWCRPAEGGEEGGKA